VDKLSDQLTVETNPLPQEATKRTFLLGLDKFQEHLAKLARDSGSKAELGRRLGVTGQFIDLLIAGKRRPGKKLLGAIGARKVVMLEFEAGNE
jgi:hypothetical protein